jgi:hypothetical protein
VYEETVVLIAGNLAALVLNLLVGLAVFLLLLAILPIVGLPVVVGEDTSGVQWLLAAIACLIPFMPTPGNIAVAGLTRVAAGPDAPRFASFREALGLHWRLALRCTLVSSIILLALIWNVGFYLAVNNTWLRFASILWAYGLVFWLCLHIYLLPLVVHVAEPRLIDLYRRAALIALGHFGYSVLLLFFLVVFSLVAVAFLPVYVLVGGAFISLVQAHALREIRRRHGDLVVEAEEEVSRL